MVWPVSKRGSYDHRLSKTDVVNAPKGATMKILLTALLSLCLISPAYAADVDVPDLINHYAAKYDVSADTMNKVISCESGYDPHAIGDQGNALGLVQINLLYHPDVTRAQAFDPNYALNFLAYFLSVGKGRLWTCYRIMVK